MKIQAKNLSPYFSSFTAPTPFTGCPVLYRRLSGSHCDSLTSLDMARVRRLHQCPRSSGQLLPAQPNYFYSINSNCATFCHVAWEIPVGSASQGRRCSNDKTNNYYATTCASERVRYLPPLFFLSLLSLCRHCPGTCGLRRAFPFRFRGRRHSSTWQDTDTTATNLGQIRCRGICAF